MERKLRLVPPLDDGGSPGKPGSAPMPPAPSEPNEDAPISDEERAAAEALRDVIDRGEEPLAAELRAAFAPSALAEADLDAVLARAMGDESAATRAERDAAERLRAELEGEAPVREAAALHALRLAAAPPALDPARNEELIEAALARADEQRRARRAVVGRRAAVAIAAISTVTALAAGLSLFFGQPRRDAPATAALIPARSTEELFDAATPFPRRGEESARIDRIAAARASDLRANRFAAWGVR
jgi:hypothetical protein